MELVSKVERSVSVAASLEQAWALISDSPASIAHFPEMESLTREADGSYLWKLKKVGVGRVSIQLTYAARYTKREQRRQVTWEPVPGVGNGLVSGTWTVAEEGPQRTRLTLQNQLVLELPLPRLLRPVAEPFVARENARMIEEYVDNLKTTLEGGDGRVSAHAIRV